MHFGTDIVIGPRRRGRRKRGRARTAPGIAGGAAPGRSAQRRRRESAAWKAGDWDAGDDYAVEAILDRKPATTTDVLNYADTEGADVSVGSDMYWVKWEGWGSEYNSWEPRSFIIDEQLIHDYENGATDNQQRAGWPTTVLEVRRRRTGGRGRARLEARCAWPGDGEDESRWVHATQGQIGARAMAAAKALDGGAAPQRVNHFQSSNARVTTRQRRRERERSAGDGDDDDGPRSHRRRRPLAIIPEDGERSSDDEK
jgi:hypothetical protein